MATKDKLIDDLWALSKDCSAMAKRLIESKSEAREAKRESREALDALKMNRCAGCTFCETDTYCTYYGDRCVEVGTCNERRNA